MGDDDQRGDPPKRVRAEYIGSMTGPIHTGEPGHKVIRGKLRPEDDD